MVVGWRFARCVPPTSNPRGWQGWPFIPGGNWPNLSIEVGSAIRGYYRGDSVQKFLPPLFTR